MRTCLALLSCFGIIATTRADDDCRAVVLRAIQAHGGKETINKYRGVEIKYKGTFAVMGMDSKAEGEIYLNDDNRMKHIVNFEINNNTISVRHGFDGKDAWLTVADMSMDLTDRKAIAEITEHLHADHVSRLVRLDSDRFKLAPLGEATIDGRSAIGVCVRTEGKRDVNLWFDRKTDRLVKTEFRAKEPPFFQGQEMLIEKFVSEYKTIDGVLTPMRVILHYDGQKSVDLEISEVRGHERLDDTHFAKP